MREGKRERKKANQACATKTGRREIRGFNVVFERGNAIERGSTIMAGVIKMAAN